MISLQSKGLSKGFSNTSAKASILQHSAFFIVQFSHPYMTTGKAIALTHQTFVGKIMSLLFNMLSTLFIAFLLRSKRLLISWLQSPSSHQKKVFFIIGDWNSKIGSQKIPRITDKFGLGVQHEAGQRITEFCQENIWIIANTLFQQHKRQLCTWTSPDGEHRNQIAYIFCSQRWRTSVQSTKTRPGADCGSDHELLIAKFRL